MLPGGAGGGHHAWVQADWRGPDGGGWQVEHAGTAYRVSVGFRPLTPGASFPLSRAEALVLDERLQATP